MLKETGKTVQIKIYGVKTIKSVDDGNWTNYMTSRIYTDYSATLECVTEGVSIGTVRDFIKPELARWAIQNGGSVTIDADIKEVTNRRLKLKTVMGHEIIGSRRPVNNRWHNLRWNGETNK